MKITAVVCTYNRCQILKQALESIAASKVPASVDWEVLIVDNNSKDETRAVAEEFCRKDPARFRYVFESEQGLSAARNAGFRESRGDVVAYTDDDAVVEPDWLWNLTAALQEREWIGSAGRIVPVWPGSLPGWLSTSDPNMMGPFGAFDLGKTPISLTRPPYGGNMAFRKEAFERYGGFRTNLGRSGSNLQGREDVEFGNRLLEAGERLRYEPDAVIHHPVFEQRLTKSYVLRWWYWYGRSEISETGAPESKWSIAGIPLYYVHRLARWALESLITFKPSKRFSCQLRAAYIVGLASECYQGQHRPKAQESSYAISGADAEIRSKTT